MSVLERKFLVFALAAVTAAALAGCVSESKARAQSRQAFVAGQRAALLQAQQQQQQQQAAYPVPTVTVVGEVKNPAVAWVPGLTLSQVIL